MTHMTPPPDDSAPDRVRLLSRGYWVMMGFGALCMIAAAVVAVLGPRLFARSQRPTSPPTVATMSAATVGAPTLGARGKER
jgi:hypothetical protein